MYYGGDSTSAVPIFDIYYNGVLKVANQGFPGGGNGAIPLPTALANEPLILASGYGVKDNEWYGGLSDAAIWGTNLTGAASVGPAPRARSATRAARFWRSTTRRSMGRPHCRNTASAPWTNCFRFMTRIRTSTVAVTTGNSTLTWQYVASGLPGTSGSAGTLAGGGYYVQLNSSGGGVQTVVPEPASFALLVSGMAGLLAYARRKSK